MTPIFAPLNVRKTRYTIGEVAFDMCYVEVSDNFRMGNEKRQDQSETRSTPVDTRVVAAYKLGEYPVTQALWEAVINVAGQQGLVTDSLPTSPHFRGGHRPIDMVSCDEAKHFCELLNKLLGKPAVFFRLPTEAEWEYAARIGRCKYNYSGSNMLEEVGWYKQNNNEETCHVGMLVPNAIGVYGLTGNVWEWCEDNLVDSEREFLYNGILVKRIPKNTLLGGSWYSRKEDCHTSYRFAGLPIIRPGSHGFRLACSVT